MYKFHRNQQMSFTDFNQPAGMQMDPENRWVKKAASIPWYDIEIKYAALFPSETGMPAKPLQTALGSLMIQKKYDYSDRELVEQIKENAYYQYFIGLPGYSYEAPFAPSLLVEFRKRLTDDILEDINEMMIQFNLPENNEDDDSDNNSHSDGGEDAESKENEKSEADNKGTLILDATCAPQNISYPQDINLLNEARENLESIIDDICYTYNFYKPRMYRKNARKDYLNLAKCKKRTKKKIRKAIKQQLQYIRRDLGYIDMFVLANGVVLTEKQAKRLTVIKELYEQQKYMYDNNVHSVKDRIVSISQPYIRPIVRGKAKAPVECGAKLDMSIDENGFARLERLSFDAYNEADVLISAIERYRKRTGRYPERVLVDQIYRNRNNRAFCKSKGIRISGPALGRPKKEPTPEERKTAYSDNTDRIEVERGFSLAKRCCGLGLIRTKLDTTTRCSIALTSYTQPIQILFHIDISDIFRISGFPAINHGSGCNLAVAVLCLRAFFLVCQVTVLRGNYLLAVLDFKDFAGKRFWVGDDHIKLTHSKLQLKDILIGVGELGFEQNDILHHSALDFTHDPFHNAAAFHCGQSAELLVKQHTVDKRRRLRVSQARLCDNRNAVMAVDVRKVLQIHLHQQVEYGKILFDLCGVRLVDFNFLLLFIENIKQRFQCCCDRFFVDRLIQINGILSVMQQISCGKRQIM